MTSEIDIVFVDLAVIAAWIDDEERATPRLAASDVARAARIMATRDADGRAWRAARIATRIILERWCGSAIRSLPFVIEDGGRPTLPQSKAPTPQSAATAPAFSVSHSGDAALIAISSDGPIGVDLEAPRQLAMSPQRRALLLTAAARLSRHGDAADLTIDGSEAGVLRAWVQLEAVAKASGLGIGRVLTAHGVVGGRVGDAGQTAITQDIAVRDLAVGGGYAAAIAMARSALPSDPILAKPFPTKRADLADFLKR